MNATHNKTGDTKLLPINEELQELLERRHKARVEGCPYVFHRAGAFIRDFRKAWNKAIGEAGYSGRVFHALRRSPIRDKIGAGVHEDVAMKISGHKTQSVFSRYNISSENDILLALQKTREYRLSQTLSHSPQEPAKKAAKPLK